MKKRIWIPLLTGSLLMVGVFIVQSGNQPDNVLSETTVKPSNKRMYSSELQKTGGFIYPGSSVKEWMEYEGGLYILDAESQKITSFRNGKENGVYLDISGEAPWENLQVQHMWIDQSGISTVDNSHMVVKKHTMSDSLLFYRKLDEPLWDGVYMKNDRFFLLDDEAADPSFFTINARTGTKSDPIFIAELIPETVESEYLNIVFEGQILRNENQIVYLCSRTGYFMIFNMEGSYQFTGRTIDQTPPPKVTARKTGNITYFVREPDLNINYSGTMDDTFLYILSLISWKQTSTLTVDCYRLSDGRYEKSFNVPNVDEDLPIEILAGKDNLYVLYEGMQIITYNLEKDAW